MSRYAYSASPTLHSTSRTRDHDPIEPTYIGYCETVGDAVVLLEAAKRGLVKLVKRRIPADQRGKLIKSGRVFIFKEDSANIKRWTDGRTWSPSRIAGDWLVYREPSREGERTRASRSQDSSILQGLARQKRLRSLVVSLTDNSKIDKGHIKPDGLVKRAITISVYGGREVYHVISYYKPYDVLDGRLQRPTMDTGLGYLLQEVSSEFLDPRNFRRAPPRVTKDAYGRLVYVGEDLSMEQYLVPTSPSSMPSPIVTETPFPLPHWPTEPAMRCDSQGSETDFSRDEGEYSPTTSSASLDVESLTAPSPAWEALSIPPNTIDYLPATTQYPQTEVRAPATPVVHLVRRHTYPAETSADADVYEGYQLRHADHESNSYFTETSSGYAESPLYTTGAMRYQLPEEPATMTTPPHSSTFLGYLAPTSPSQVDALAAAGMSTTIAPALLTPPADFGVEETGSYLPAFEYTQQHQHHYHQHAGVKAEDHYHGTGPMF
ncbi:hypothetical protein FRB99_007661 [Tulasnella sp. 403]|nr:hypothetical protein FRB99_007661 [Tulasnella sp. 403]